MTSKKKQFRNGTPHSTERWILGGVKADVFGDPGTRVEFFLSMRNAPARCLQS